MFVYMQKQFVPKARICKKKGRRKKNYSKKVKKEKYSDTVSHSYVRPFLRSFSKAKKIFVGKYNQYFWRVFKEVNNTDLKWKKENAIDLLARDILSISVSGRRRKKKFINFITYILFSYDECLKEKLWTSLILFGKKKKETVRSKALLEMFGYLCAWMSFWRKKKYPSVSPPFGIYDRFFCLKSK